MGLARDQGEGIPRMFSEMEDAFLPRPEIETDGRDVSVIQLTARVFWDRGDVSRWISELQARWRKIDR
jgi:predicted HTH transcriptional regulator